MFLGGGVRVRGHSYPVWAAEIPLKVLQLADSYSGDFSVFWHFLFAKLFFSFLELMTSLCF